MQRSQLFPPKFGVLGNRSMAAPATANSGFSRALGSLPPELVIFGRSHPMQAVRQRIERALELVSSTALWVTPDCGLKTRTVEEAIDKLGNMVAATREVRAAVAAGQS